MMRMMRIELRIDGEPPVRADPGRCADRHSPNAAPLADAGQRLVGQNPTRFPLTEAFGITLRLGSTVPATDDDGYSVDSPIVEVLVDVGVIADERLEDWMRCSQDPAWNDYEVTIEPA